MQDNRGQFPTFHPNTINTGNTVHVGAMPSIIKADEGLSEGMTRQGLDH